MVRVGFALTVFIRLCAYPEIVPLICVFFFFQCAIIAKSCTAALNTEGGVCEYDAVSLAWIRSKTIDAGLNRAGLGLYPMQIQIHNTKPCE